MRRGFKIIEHLLLRSIDSSGKFRGGLRIFRGFFATAQCEGHRHSTIAVECHLLLSASKFAFSRSASSRAVRDDLVEDSTRVCSESSFGCERIELVSRHRSRHARGSSTAAEGER